MTPDPYRASGRPRDPQSWNHYAYAGGDPVNRLDPSGLDYVAPIDPGSCGASADPNYLGCDPGGPGYCDASEGPGACTNYCDGSDGFAPMPGPNCEEDGQSSPQVAPQPIQLPCYADFPKIDTTLTNLGQDILGITAQKDAAITGADLLALGATIGADIQSEMTHPIDFFNGGHFALDLALSSVASDFGGSNTAAYQDFVHLFNPPSIFNSSGNGSRYPTPVPTTDPSHSYYLHDHNNNGILDFHFDRYNPYHHFPIGTIQHGAVDVLYGHLGTHCLDPAWR
jgi:hypothetical protein